MRKRDVNLVVIGGGPAGLAAALSAYTQGVRGIVLIERDLELGGILQQCIHNGFGVHYFKEELTGPEYAERFIDRVLGKEIEVRVNTMVLEVTPDKQVFSVNRAEGMVVYQAKAVILAMGCRERTREALAIPGSRPAGVFTAGTAQRYINMEGYLPGKKVLILGSGDIGLIMARRMTLEGAKVLGVLEIMPYSNGLTRNIVQCLDDYEIPLFLQHTVVQIHGRKRIEGVTIARVDESFQTISGTERYEEVDTLLLSVGLIPENELSRMAEVEIDLVTGGAIVNQYRETSVSGVFACGNVLHVHDLVDYVTEEAEVTGRGVARYLSEEISPEGQIQILAGEKVRYVIPQNVQLLLNTDLEFYLRVTQPIDKGEIKLYLDGELIFQKGERYLKPAEMLKIKLRADKIFQKELTVKSQIVFDVEVADD